MATIQGFEDAVRTWVKSGSGFDDAHVFFNDQPVPKLAGPHITIRLTNVDTLGLVDITTNFDEARDPGVEVEVVVAHDLEVDASIQVWSAPPITPSSAPDAAPSAVAIALTLQQKAYLPSVSDALSDAGVSLIDLGSINNVSRLLDATWEGRAQFAAKFYIRDSVSEFTTFIERAEVEHEDNGDVLVLE